MVPLIGVACSIEKGSFRIGQAYVQAIEQVGGVAIGIPPMNNIEHIVSVLQRFDGLLLPGGNDIDPMLYHEDIIRENGALEPERDRLELAIVQWALAHDVPLLGICRGLQMLNVAAGGTLYQDIPAQADSALQHRQKAPRWYGTHAIHIEHGTQLADIFQPDTLRVNSFHHQAVKKLAPGFIASARANDNMIEAIESPQHRFAVGVQWHPEAMLPHDPNQATLFKAFMQAVVQKKKDDHDFQATAQSS